MVGAFCLLPAQTHHGAHKEREREARHQRDRVEEYETGLVLVGGGLAGRVMGRTDPVVGAPS